MAAMSRVGSVVSVMLLAWTLLIGLALRVGAATPTHELAFVAVNAGNYDLMLLDGRRLSTLNMSGSFTQVPFAVEVTAQSLRSGILAGIVIGVLARIGPAVRAIRRNVASTLAND